MVGDLLEIQKKRGGGNTLKSNFILTSDGELLHYGVKGMKWGIRKGIDELSLGTRNAHNSGVARLNTHRDKINKKIGSLDKQHTKLQKTRDKQIQTADVKAAKLNDKASNYRSKSARFYTSFNKSQKLQDKASRLEMKADRLISKSKLTQSKIDKNRSIRKLFEKGLSDIDNELCIKGQDFLYMKRDGTPYTYADLDVPE